MRGIAAAGHFLRNRRFQRLIGSAGIAKTGRETRCVRILRREDSDAGTLAESTSPTIAVSSSRQ